MNIDNFFVLLVLTFSGQSKGLPQDAEDSSDVNLTDNNSPVCGIDCKLPFRQEETGNETTVIYDCSAGTVFPNDEKAEIRVEDKTHPTNMSTLIVENCENVTIVLSSSPGRLQQLIIRNNGAVRFVRVSHPEEPQKKSKPTGSIHISNVNQLEMPEDSLIAASDRILSLTLEKVKMKILSVESGWLRDIVMTGVEIQTVKKFHFSMAEEGTSTLRITDSRFEEVQRFNGRLLKAEISNNHFGTISQDGFTITATESFTFSENYVGKMFINPFKVISPKVKITGNTLDVAHYPWLAGLKIENSPSNLTSVLNVSDNTMNEFPNQFFALDEASRPDLIIFKGNLLKCSCRNWLWFAENESGVRNLASRIFFRKENKNGCVNYHNCDIETAITGLDDLCAGKFNCTRKEDPQSVSVTSQLNLISSGLRNITKILHSLVEIQSQKN